MLFRSFTSVFAVLTVVNMSLASPKSSGENTLDMLEIMTRAFDESEGGEGSIPPCPESGYQSTGKREIEERITYKVTWDCGAGIQVGIFIDWTQAHAVYQAYIHCAGSLESTYHVGYKCDQSNSNLCWVCNMYIP